MHIELKGRTALVTGGSRGIGRAIAERLGRSGADVAIVARRADVIDETVDELQGVVAGRIAGYACDVSDEAAIERAFARFPPTSTASTSWSTMRARPCAARSCRWAGPCSMPTST